MKREKVVKKDEDLWLRYICRPIAVYISKRFILGVPLNKNLGYEKIKNTKGGKRSKMMFIQPCHGMPKAKIRIIPFWLEKLIRKIKNKER